MLFALQVLSHITLSTVLLTVNHTIYIVCMGRASALATCNITPSNMQYRQILHLVCRVTPIENIYVVRLIYNYTYITIVMFVETMFMRCKINIYLVIGARSTFMLTCRIYVHVPCA